MKQRFTMGDPTLTAGSLPEKPPFKTSHQAKQEGTTSPLWGTSPDWMQAESQDFLLARACRQTGRNRRKGGMFLLAGVSVQGLDPIPNRFLGLDHCLLD